MPTDVIHKIGATNSPTTMDYSSLSSWNAAAASTYPSGLVVGDVRWIGEAYDQGKFTAGVSIGSGVTVDSTRYFILRCASGASFNTKAGVRTTALFYNSTTGSGVAIETSAADNITLSANYTQLDGLQTKGTGYSIGINANATNTTVKNCIITRTGGAGNLIKDGTSSCKWINNLILYQFSSGVAIDIVGQLYNCSVVNSGGSAGTSFAIHSEYNVATANNTAFFGFNTNLDTGTTLGSTSDYNATDLGAIGTGGGGGTHNVTGLTYASQFTSTTTDYRAILSSGLHAGTPDSTNAPLDISLTTRNATTPYIGAWEATAPASGFTISPSSIPKNHSGNITLTLAGSGTSFNNGTTVFTFSGPTGSTKVSQNVSSTTAATVVVTTGSGTGTITLTETVTGTNTNTTTVATGTISASPSSVVVSSGPLITFTGTNTVWTQETPSTLLTMSALTGCSLGTPTVTTDTACTATLTTGSTLGTVTVTDNSDGAVSNTITVAAVSGSITVTRPVQWQGHWRDPGTGLGAIPITGTYTGGPGTLTIEAKFNTGSFATIATGSGGNFSGTLTGQSPGFGTLTVRFVTATSINTTVTNIAIGVVIGIAGQSNAAGELNSFQTYSNGAGLKPVVFAAGNSSYTTTAFWAEANDPLIGGWVNGSPWPLLATHLMNSLSMPVIFVETAIGGRSLVPYWTRYLPATGLPGSGSSGPTTGYGEIHASMAAASLAGMDAVIWYQGEQDCDTAISRHVYLAALMTFADQIASEFASAPKLAIVQFGHDGSASSVPASQADAIKLALADGVNTGGNILNGMVVISDYSIGLHILTNPEAQKCADRMFAVLKSEVFGGTAGAGRGPRVVSIQYNTARTQITITYDKILKTGLTMSTALWAVTGNGTPGTVSSVAYGTDPTSVVLTMSGAISTPIVVSFGLGGSTAGLVWPLGPDFVLPASAGTINLPAEMFSGVTAALASGPGGGGGSGAAGGRIFTGQ